jgi:hypothetical protein
MAWAATSSAAGVLAGGVMDEIFSLCAATSSAAGKWPGAAAGVAALMFNACAATSSAAGMFFGLAADAAAVRTFIACAATSTDDRVTISSSNARSSPLRVARNADNFLSNLLYAWVCLGSIVNLLSIPVRVCKPEINIQQITLIVCQLGDISNYLIQLLIHF